MMRVTSRLFADAPEQSKTDGVIPTYEDLLSNYTSSKNFQILDTESIFTNQYFQEKGNHFKIDNPHFKLQVYSNLITGCSENGVMVNNVMYTTPVIVTKNKVFVWDLTSWNDLRMEHFLMYKFIKPAPKYIIIASGETINPLPREIRDHFETLNYKVDVLDWFLAAGTFNISMEQDIEVIAFFNIR